MMQNPVPHHCGRDPRRLLGLGLSVTWDSGLNTCSPPIGQLTAMKHSYWSLRGLIWSPVGEVLTPEN